MPIPHKLAKRAKPLTYKAGRDVLALFERYPLLTANQAVALMAHTPTYTKRWLKELAERGILNDRTLLPHYQTSVGGVPKLYRTSQHDLSPLFLPHRHTLTDVLISAELLGREDDIELLEWVHERDLRKAPVSVTMPDGTARKVMMDGFVGYQYANQKYFVGIEADCGTEQREQWQTKVRALLLFASTVYPQRRPGDSLTLAVYVRAMRKHTPNRLRTLLDWTAQELADEDPAWDHFFRFTLTDPAVVAPREFWLGSHWVSPTDRTPGLLVPEARQ